MKRNKPDKRTGAAAGSAARLNAAISLHRNGLLDEAAQIYREIVQAQPGNFDAVQMLAVVAAQRNDCAGALELFDRALRLKPDHAGAWNNRGNALLELGRVEDALQSFARATVLQPDYAEAFYNRGNALLDLNRCEEALQSYERALAIAPDYAQAHYNRGNALLALQRPAQALESLDRALKLDPGDAQALSNRGNALLALGRGFEAIDSYDRALALAPDLADAHYARGTALLGLNRMEAALQSFDRALALQPQNASALNNRGNALLALKRTAEALQSYERAFAIAPDLDFLHGLLLHARTELCDWRDLDGEVERMTAKILRGERAAPLLAVLALSDSPAVQRQAAGIWMRERHPASAALGAFGSRAPHAKIHVGYFSADFRIHPVAYLTAELFEAHDRARFELTAFSFGPDSGDEMRRRAEAAFDHFVDVRERSDAQIALLARQMQIDIAVDLGGHTRGSRPGIFALRAAPLQVSYLGSPGTMGADYIDYLVADATLIAQADRRHYVEKIICLPSYQVNDSARPIADRAFSRQELGLPDSGFVYCCFNANYKITPAVFECWMRILGAVAGSVLWLAEGAPGAADNLRKEAQRRGIAAERLIFAGRVPTQAEHLARLRAADLFLDTLPYNAQATAGDALWAGVPVLTCAGSTFAGRVAASLLTALQLPELITAAPQAYEALAIVLAADRARLDALRRKLAANRLTTALFDARAFARNIEAAYAQIHARHQAGLPPDHIVVQA